MPDIIGETKTYEFLLTAPWLIRYEEDEKAEFEHKTKEELNEIQKETSSN